MNEALYDTTRRAITGAMLFTDDSTTKAQLGHVAHETTYDIFRAVCAELREHPDLDLEQALFLFGERP